MSPLSFSDIVSLLGGIALFLFGMALMGDSLKKVAGDRLEVVLYRLTNTPLKGFLLGAGVTAVIQSSSATSVMVVGFVNSGMMRVRESIGIILGAILGTSVTGWVLTLSSIGGTSTGWMDILSTSTLTGAIAVVGIILYSFSKNQTKNNVGGVLLGFAVLMYGMSAMSSAVAPLRESESFIAFLTSFSNPILGIMVGLLFTAIIQSASAAVGILQALSVTGAITFSVAFPIIMGIAIGASVPVLLSAIGATTNGRRTAFIYPISEILGALVLGALFYIVNAFLPFAFMGTVMDTVTIALLNTVYRLLETLMLLPFVGQLEKLVSALIPDTPEEKSQQEAFNLLEDRFLETPPLAIEQCRITINQMAQQAQDNLLRSLSLLDHYSEEEFQAVSSCETVIDNYEDKLGTYLIKITGKALSKEQAESTTKYLHAISDFERISDHALNIAECAQEKYSKEISFSLGAVDELNVLRSALQEVLKTAIQAFIDNNIEQAYHVEPLEELIDQLCDEMKLHHVERVQKGICSLSQGFVFNDLLTNFERVSDHCSNVAVAMIELESDEFETHSYLDGVKAMRSHNFDRYYEEYRKKYSLPDVYIQ